MRRVNGPEGPRGRGPVATPAVLGVPGVQSSFLDHLPAPEASETGGEVGHHCRAGQEPRHSRADTDRIAPHALVGAATSRTRAPSRPWTSTREPATGEPTISLDFHQQTSLDWHLSIWGGVTYGASEACSAREPRSEAGSSSVILRRRQRSRCATRACQGVREVLTVTLAHQPREGPNRSSGPGPTRGASLCRGGGSGVRVSEEYVWQAVRSRVS